MDTKKYRGREAQTGPAEYMATSAIMSKGQNSFEALCSLPCLTKLTAASAYQADQSMLDQSSLNIMAPNHNWGDWAKVPLPQPLCIFKICSWCHRQCTHCHCRVACVTTSHVQVLCKWVFWPHTCKKWYDPIWIHYHFTLFIQIYMLAGVTIGHPDTFLCCCPTEAPAPPLLAPLFPPLTLPWAHATTNKLPHLLAVGRLGPGAESADCFLYILNSDMSIKCWFWNHNWSCMLYKLIFNIIVLI